MVYAPLRTLSDNELDALLLSLVAELNAMQGRVVTLGVQSDVQDDIIDVLDEVARRARERREARRASMYGFGGA